MLKWFQGLDVNAVMAMVLAAVAYIHNHSFRVAVASGNPPQPGASSVAATTLLLLVLVAVAQLGGCSASDKRVERAEASCLEQYGPEIANAFSQGSKSGDAVGITLSWEALVCADKALGTRAVTTKPLDAAAPSA
jgi:hypothetical protein